MKLYKNIGTILLTSVMLLAGEAAGAQTLATNLVTSCENYVHITGESNVNQFTFTYSSVPRNARSDNASTKEYIEISIPVKQFEASNPLMYKDFLELMKAEHHPRIIISFARKQLEKALLDNSESCPEVNITIAGITKKYTIDCSIVKCSGNMYLKGKEVVKLSDFSLKPPAKLMGLVKVNNEIDVNFGFIITFTDNNTFSATL